MAFFFMGAMERSWSRTRFVLAYLLLLISPPLSLWIAAMASGLEQTAMGLWLSTAGWTIVYGSYRPKTVLLVFGIAPVKAIWIAAFAAGAIIFYYGRGAPLAGLCTGLAPLLAWMIGSGKLPLALPEGRLAKPGDEFRKSMKTKRESELERLRLRELLERSVEDDDTK